MAATSEPNYTKYLETDPTQLMVHIEKWIRDRAEIDPTKFKTKAEAFAYGVYMTVHLRGIHQASEENQDRLEANRKAASNADAQRLAAREARSAAGAKPRGRLPKEKAAVATEEPEPVKPARKRRAAATKAAAAPVATVATEETEKAAPKRRAPRKAAAEKAETSPEPAKTDDNVTPIRRRRAARRGTEAAF